MKRAFIFSGLLIMLFLPDCISQERLRIGLMPHVNLNWKMLNEWRLNAKYESRLLTRERDAEEIDNRIFRYQHSDLSMIATRKTGLSSHAGGGYLMRFGRERVTHRTIQQFSIVRHYRRFGLAHRFVGDQTFGRGLRTQWRFRYRIGLDFALQGESVDPLEFYFKLTNEYLNVFRGGSYDLEIRLMPVIGFVLENHNKLELGLDARYDSFIGGRERGSYWIMLGWFISMSSQSNN